MSTWCEQKNKEQSCVFTGVIKKKILTIKGQHNWVRGAGGHVAEGEREDEGEGGGRQEVLQAVHCPRIPGAIGEGF
jgi:hypothetical protein